MKIVTVVGARPQFIKAAVVSEEIRKKHKEVLVHTGQHFDYNMSQLLFEELSIPKPDYNLGISGGTHADMTGRMMVGIEQILLEEQPDWVVVYGDTNSTLAAALASAKLYIPICHIEAGVRAHSNKSPEEINRICTDHVSSLLLASSESGYNELKNEGLGERAVVVGDPMYDAFLKNSCLRNVADIELQKINGETIAVPNEYYYLTCHREENTSDKSLLEILRAMNLLDRPVIYPVHPRNKSIVARLDSRQNFNNMMFVEPIGYLESLALVKNAKKIVTDSGGLQREAFYAGVQCVTILDSVIWPETMVGNRNQLAEANEEDILDKLRKEQEIDINYMPFGDGKAAQRVVRELKRLERP